MSGIHSTFTSWLSGVPYGIADPPAFDVLYQDVMRGDHHLAEPGDKGAPTKQQHDRTLMTTKPRGATKQAAAGNGAVIKLDTRHVRRDLDEGSNLGKYSNLIKQLRDAVKVGVVATGDYCLIGEYGTVKTAGITARRLAGRYEDIEFAYEGKKLYAAVRSEHG